MDGDYDDDRYNSDSDYADDVDDFCFLTWRMKLMLEIL